MALQGLDRAAAPAPSMAKQMLDAIGGTWWNVYIGGPESGGRGWTPGLVGEYVKHGIDRFMLTYVGRQSRGPLTQAQGRADGLEALRIAKQFGYTGNFPLCLDVELRTYESAPSKAVEYAGAWCATVRDGGARPGVYANPTPLKAMAQAHVPADFVWVASWVSHGPAPHDPHAIPQLPHELWSGRGSRAWQYAGAYGNQACRVLNLDVDINVADLGCLAKPPGHQAGRAHAGSGLVRRGARGKPVERLTRRLSYVRSSRSGTPYLDGSSRRFDDRVETALKVFQREHRLDPDGVYGPDTARALSRAGLRQRRGGSNGKPPATRPARLRTLIEDFRRLDAETDQAWERLVAYGESRQRMLGRTGDAGEDGRALSEIAGILGRMEHTLETLVAIEQRELALEERQATAGQPEVKSEAAESPATTAAPAAAAEGPNGAGAPSVAPASAGREQLVLQELSDHELQERLDRLDRARDRSRMVLMRRYLEAEKKLVVRAPRRPEEPREIPDKRPDKRPEKRPAKRPGERPRKQPETPPAEHVRELQAALNRFSGKYLEGIGPILEDGKKGPATNKRIRRIKYYLGYRGSNQRNASADPDFLRRIAHPRSGRASNPAMLTRAVARRRKQHKAAKAAAQPRAGVSTFDGLPVAAWMVPYLEWARANGWQGRLNSGYRTPEYSEHLCIGICGATRCPGRCAGRTSNHCGRVNPQGSLDVSDYTRFGELMKRCPHQPRIFNNLPADRVHYSSTGG